MTSISGSPALSGCALGGSVTPSDTVNLPYTAKAIRASGGGDVALVPAGQPTPVTVTVAANETFDMFQVTRVNQTGTTATGIIWGAG